MIYNHNDSYFNDFFKAFRVRIDSESPFEMCYVYINASNGKILNKVNLLAHADVNGSGQTYYRGLKNLVVNSYNGTFRLRDMGRKIWTFDATNATISNAGFSNESDYTSNSSYFGNKRRIETLNISNISNSWWNSTPTNQYSSLYLKIKSGGQVIYQSVALPVVSLSNVQFSNLTAFLEPNTTYTVELWKKGISQDSFGGSFTVNTQNSNFTSWSANGSSGNYKFVNSGNPGVDVHWGMQQTYDFYSTVFNLNSFNGNNTLIKQYVNPPFLQYKMEGGNPNNAFALPAPYNSMVYGLGDGNLLNPVVGLDVEGHEYTHLVVNNNGNGGLVYMAESGALNESFADIFGTAVEFFVNDNPNWTIGENVGAAFDNMRSMSNPNNPNGLSQQPDTYLGDYWADTSNISEDNGGVHINSGVQNFWFYLLSEGGSGTNDNGDAYNVTGIGINDARRIAYRNLMNYLNSNATYMTAYSGSLQAAEDLFGANSTQYNAVVDAWYAVGIGEDTDPAPTSGCLAQSILTEPSGTITDGSGNENYQNNAACSWFIAPENATQVTLIFTEFALENNYDFVYVGQYVEGEEEPELLQQFTGTIDLPTSISSTEGVGNLLVVFTSDGTVNAQGFTANYTSTVLANPNFEMQSKLKVYPNPSNGIFDITSDFNEALQVEMFDTTGKRVLNSRELSKGSTTINVSNLASGTYLLKFTKGKDTHTEKIIIK